MDRIRSAGSVACRIMQGGGFKVDTLATVTALETMVYNTTGAGYAAGPITVAGNVVMTAPLSGSYQGISLFQDRTLATPITMSGIGLTVLTGVVYAAQATVSLTGLAAVGLDVLAAPTWQFPDGSGGAVNVDLKLNPPRVPDVRSVE